MRIVEVITDTAYTDSLAGIAEHFEAMDFWLGVANEDGRRSFLLLILVAVILIRGEIGP